MRARNTAVLIALVWGLGPARAAAQDAAAISVCADCHAGVDVQKLAALDHGEGVECMTCHHLGFTNDPSLTKLRRREACVSCHEGTERVRVTDAHAGLEGDLPSCVDCHSVHSDPAPDSAGVAISARCSACHRDTSHSLHSGVSQEAPVCTDCHVGHPLVPTGATAAWGTCASCHRDSHPTHRAVGADLDCAQCHGIQDPPAGGSEFAAQRQCGVCHQDLYPSHAEVDREGTPSCLDCHDFRLDPRMEETGPTTSRRCAECHEDEWNDHAGGGHAEALAQQPNGDLPTCVTCHPTHMDPGADRAQLRLAATMRCIECHSQELLVDEYGLPLVAPSYEDDFHGVTARFMWNHPEAGDELPPVMICSDCHGAHKVGWEKDAVVADVCRRCHPESDAYLAGAWLGHGDVAPDHQPLVFLVKVFYYVLIPFMLGGLFLTIVLHLSKKRRQGARMLRSEGVRRLRALLSGRRSEPEQTVTRFSLWDRWEHVGSALTFILLVVTGLPQTRPDLPAANALIGFMGGIGATRLIHRGIGFTFVALMLLHVGRAVFRAIRGHRLPVMVPNRKDFTDIVQAFRHYLLGEAPPRFAKFDFGEKFEYWGLFLGSIVMSATGLVLVFPELVTQVLPGVIVAALRVMHGLEATFAVMVVILWHSWSVALRPEVFPLDTSIFTGKMRVSQLEHEHAAEYARLFPDRVGEHEAEDADRPPETVVGEGEPGLAGA